MTAGIKQQVLAALENSRGAHISGEELARRLHVSRNSVWKAVRALAEDGYNIQAVQNKGYCLSQDTDIPSEQSVSRHLGEGAGMFRLSFCKAVDSTNNALKKLAAAGEPEGLVLVAEEQRAGRGRMNRSFFSPPGTGVYMSLLLRPKVSAADSPLITLAAAVAVAGAVEAVSGKRTCIKWVNDVVMDSGKVCGILTEASLDLESGSLDYAVLGIGVNAKTPDDGFPDELNGVAGAVFGRGEAPPDTRSRIVAEILNRFGPYYRELGGRAFMHEYRERSMIVGKEIMILGAGNEQATALAVDNDGHLHVRLANGETAVLSSGEVSVRVLEGKQQ